MEGVFDIFNLEVGEQKSLGVATISTYEFSNDKDPLYNLRAMLNGNGMMTMKDGKYVRIHVGQTLMMSDTRMEKNSNEEFISKANGKVFIAGLGIGLIIHNLKDKIESGLVTEIVVMEKYRDVIDLVAPYFKGYPITYRCDDVLTYIPDKKEKFDTIYFDIWPDINTDNLSEIAMLHNRWKNRKNRENPNVWMGSWMQDYLKAERRRENADYGWY